MSKTTESLPECRCPGPVADCPTHGLNTGPRLRAEIDSALGEPTTCKVWVGDLLRFDGVSRDALVKQGETRAAWAANPGVCNCDLAVRDAPNAAGWGEGYDTGWKAGHAAAKEEAVKDATHGGASVHDENAAHP